MFDGVARRYDVTNDILSLGQDRRWRKRVVRSVAPKPGEVILDLAAGTGTSSEPFAANGVAIAVQMRPAGGSARPRCSGVTPRS